MNVYCKEEGVYCIYIFINIYFILEREKECLRALVREHVSRGKGSRERQK